MAKQQLVLNDTILEGDTQLAGFTVDDARCDTMALVVVQDNLEKSKLLLGAAADGDLAGVVFACEGKPRPR